MIAAPRWQRSWWGITIWLLALYAGAELATWLAIGPMLDGLHAEAYVSAHQLLTRAFKPAMPILGASAATGVLGCVVLAALEGGRLRLAAAAGALVSCAVSILVTAIHNDGINTTVATWTASAPPPDWSELRAAWIATNPLRTLTLLGALALILVAVLAAPGVRPIVWERVLTREILIEATPAAIWAVLTDLPAHRTWNTYAPEWSGTLAPGEELHIVAKPGGTERRFRAIIHEVRPDALLAYRAHLLSPPIMRMAHEIELRDAGTHDGRPRCTLVQRETIAGLLVPLVWPIFERQAGTGFAQMNEDLKRVAESRSS
jgi:uncharacterized membrane protein